MNRYPIILLFILISTTAVLNPIPRSSLSGQPSDRQTAPSSLDPARVIFQEVAGGLTEPVFITNAGNGSGRIFVVEQTGRIRIIKNGILLGTPFLDIHTLLQSASSEQGLLALAFHPSYNSNGEFFVAYTAPRSGDSIGSNLVLEKFSVSASDPDQADPSSGVILLTIDHPNYSNHNGGTLAFGQDTYLYWSTGDGGSGGDPNNNAQNLASLLGKILRIDVNSGSPYGIPTTNPFYGSVDPNIKKEIWAYGLRNPWRLSFDRLTADLYIGDVGQSAREEIDFQSANSAGGENYGWRVMEGSLCYNPPSGCDQSGKILPVTEYDHSLGCAITGGYVYRGSNFPSLYGQYFYSDYCSGRFFSLYNDPNTGWTTTRVLDTLYAISTFGEDEAGEIYLADYGAGKLYNIGYQEVEASVTIAGTNMGSTFIPKNTTISQGYTGIDNGPLKVESAQSLPIIASERVAYSPDGGTTWTSYSETMGLPSTQLTDGYAFPWYNNVDINSQLRFGNAGNRRTTVTVSVGGVVQGSYPLATNQSRRVNYVGLNTGPVVVTNSGGVPIVASLRVAYFDGTAWTSFSELMGMPLNKLTDSYLFPVYNNVDINSQLRFANFGNVNTTVTVTIGGIVQGSYIVKPNQSRRISYNALNDGPVKVQSSGGAPIIASMRFAYFNGSAWTDYSEMMGLPGNSISTKYLFPLYDNVHYNSQLRISNVGTVNTVIKVTVGGVLKGRFVVSPNRTRRISIAGLDGGPVMVRSSGGVPIVASQRVAYFDGSAWTSFSETMGLPQAQLAGAYFFPWYNSVDLDTQLRFGAP